VSSGVPAEIPGIGSSAMVLRVRPGFDPLAANVGPDEYFLLSRIDGKLTMRQILLAIGLPIERGIAIIHRLRAIGAVLLPGETAASAPVAQAPTLPRGASPPLRPPPPMPDVPTQRLPPSVLNAHLDAPTMRRAPDPEPTGPDLELTDPTDAELKALAEECDLSDDERQRILAMQRLVGKRDPHALLGVTPGTDLKIVKRTYFKLSKDIHPDRFYGKRLGSFAERLAIVFEAVSRAYARLTSPEGGRSSGPHPQVGAEQPQTPQEYAAELFTHACDLETSGDALGAMKLFAAAVRVAPQLRYLRRATSCALAAGQPKTALEYAKKAQAQAPSDPSVARLLATAFMAAGKLEDAEEVLVMAMAMKNENDALMGELRHDLNEVRRLLAGSH
jgi:hypothetical protein